MPRKRRGSNTSQPPTKKTKNNNKQAIPQRTTEQEIHDFISKTESHYVESIFDRQSINIDEYDPEADDLPPVDTETILFEGRQVFLTFFLMCYRVHMYPYTGISLCRKLKCLLKEIERGCRFFMMSILH